MYEHASATFAWKASSFASPSDYSIGLDSAALAQACREVRSGKGFVIVRGLPAGGSLEEFTRAVVEGGQHFGHKLSQNAQGELVSHVIDARREDPTPRMYRSNLELRPHSDITAMVALACWQKLHSGGESVTVSGVTV